MDGRGKKTLVAEDCVSNRNLLTCLLEQAQYEVHLAGDGYEALERMFNGVFDAVIIVDGHMPGLSGHEFAEFCRSAWPVTPVILLSGDLFSVMDYTEEVDSAACLRGPFEAAMLLSVLRTVTQPVSTEQGTFFRAQMTHQGSCTRCNTGVSQNQVT
jgi:CheY-like chemotaxis protein